MPSGWLPVRARLRAMAFDEGGRVTRIVAMLTEARDADARLPQQREQRDALSLALAGAYARSPQFAPSGSGASFSGYLDWHGRVMKLVQQGNDLQPIVDDIARMAEHCVAGASCSCCCSTRLATVSSASRRRHWRQASTTPCCNSR